MSGFLPDYTRADVRVSPNFGPRRDGLRPDMIILHYTGHLKRWNCEWILIVLAIAVFPAVLFL